MYRFTKRTADQLHFEDVPPTRFKADASNNFLEIRRTLTPLRKRDAIDVNSIVTAMKAAKCVFGPGNGSPSARTLLFFF